MADVEAVESNVDPESWKDGTYWGDAVLDAPDAAEVVPTGVVIVDRDPSLAAEDGTEEGTPSETNQPVLSGDEGDVPPAPADGGEVVDPGHVVIDGETVGDPTTPPPDPFPEGTPEEAPPAEPPA